MGFPSLKRVLESFFHFWKFQNSVTSVIFFSFITIYAVDTFQSENSCPSIQRSSVFSLLLIFSVFSSLFFFLRGERAVLCGMWDFSSPTKDQTHAPYIGVLTTELPGKFLFSFWIPAGQVLDLLGTFSSSFLPRPACFLVVPCSLSLTRDWTQAKAVETLSPNHWTPRELPFFSYFLSLCLLTLLKLLLISKSSLLSTVLVFLSKYGVFSVAIKAFEAFFYSPHHLFSSSFLFQLCLSSPSCDFWWSLALFSYLRVSH